VTEPELSMILPTNGLEPIRVVLGKLREQTAADRIELLIVTPAETAAEVAEEVNGFLATRVVEFDTPRSAAAARAAGVRAARAPVVAMVETHCFPEPDWAAALIDAHREPVAAVGPVVDNENPERPSSWATLFIDYAEWLAPAERGLVDHLPGHNTSYKRDLLVGYGDRLEEMLEAETILHWDLRARGERLLLEPRARVWHRNVTRWSAAIDDHFQMGRTFGAARARRWPAPRRALYSASAPLILLVRLRRILAEIRRTGRGDIIPRALPMMLSALASHAVGESVGYLAGPGRSMSRMAPYEIHRDRYVAGAS
jgi:Glycosyl transferase family 2